MMEQLYQWIAGLGPLQLWMVFGAIAFLMALAPFLRHLMVGLSVLRSGERPGIHDFSLRVVPDVLLSEEEQRQLFIASRTSHQVLYSGMTVMLNWRVTGAWRIDILPVGTDLKGNSACVALHPGRLHFVLRAYTWRGVLTKELDLQDVGLRTLGTLSLTADDHFGQPAASLQTTNGLGEKYMGRHFSKEPLRPHAGIRTWHLPDFRLLHGRIDPPTRRLVYQTALAEEHQCLTARLNGQHLVFMGAFIPRKYEKVLNSAKATATNL